MRILWCAEHEMTGLAHPRYIAGHKAQACRMVPMRLVPDNADMVERIATILSENDFTHDCNHQHHLVVALGVLDALDGETP